MASLQDQLLKAGLVDKRKAHLAKKEKQKQANLARKNGVQTDKSTQAAARQKQIQRAERDRELNQQKQQESRNKAIAAQVKQLIEVNKLGRGEDGIAYSFVYDNKVRNILVSEDQKNHLSDGHLAIVTMLVGNNRQFELVAKAVAEKIAERDGASVVQLNARSDSAELEDDPYADYQIPDDLTW